MSKIGRNDPCPCGSGEKYKKCCIDKEKIKPERVIKFSRKDLISKPYKQCPKCHKKDTFGVFTSIGGVKSYSRECINCWHTESYSLPEIKKKIIYLDQFVISNLVKLLDKDHKSHEKIKAEPFWEKLFIKLEEASRLQLIICPDSLYHRDESIVGKNDFKLMRRLYEHFSGGKTLYPGSMIQDIQINEHFKNWLQKQKTTFNFDPQNICREDLNTWTIGLGLTVNIPPLPGEIEKLKDSNDLTKEQIKSIWTRWQTEKGFKFLDRIKEETLGLWKGMSEQLKKFAERRMELERRALSGEKYNIEIEDIFPPSALKTLESLRRIATSLEVPEDKILETIGRYFNDPDSLLEIPCIHISSMMFAGLSRSAQLGKKNPPKAFTDVSFISSYLPYCDAIFVDIESRTILNDIPRETHSNLRLDKYPAKIFSLRQKEEFLDYLDQLIKNIPTDQMEILKDIEGDDHEPYWNIIEHEKKGI